MTVKGLLKQSLPIIETHCSLQHFLLVALSSHIKVNFMNLVIEENELDQLPITIDPEIVSGAPVFRGTRVPVDALLNNLKAGLTLDEFLDNFPTVTREQALQVLEFSKTTLMRLGKGNRKSYWTNALPE